MASAPKDESAAILAAAARLLKEATEKSIADQNGLLSISADMRALHSDYAALLASYRDKARADAERIAALERQLMDEASQHAARVNQLKASYAEQTAANAITAARYETIQKALGTVACVACTVLPQIYGTEGAKAQLVAIKGALDGLPEELRLLLPAELTQAIGG